MVAAPAKWSWIARLPARYADDTNRTLSLPQIGIAQLRSLPDHCGCDQNRRYLDSTRSPSAGETPSAACLRGVDQDWGRA
jgi:hypothetical protein